ncbi:MAG: hypothetical protein AB7F82_04050 [Alphaproteobacteria bacterium]
MRHNYDLFTEKGIVELLNDSLGAIRRYQVLDMIDDVFPEQDAQELKAAFTDNVIIPLGHMHELANTVSNYDPQNMQRQEKLAFAESRKGKVRLQNAIKSAFNADSITYIARHITGLLQRLNDRTAELEHDISTIDMRNQRAANVRRVERIHTIYPELEHVQQTLANADTLMDVMCPKGGAEKLLKKAKRIDRSVARSHESER